MNWTSPTTITTSSRFKITLIGGGAGGATSMTINGVTATGGTININGQYGGDGYYVSGPGASTMFGSGGTGKQASSSASPNSAGVPATGFGAGGGGAMSNIAGGAVGGNGAPGAILIEYSQ